MGFVVLLVVALGLGLAAAPTVQAQSADTCEVVLLFDRSPQEVVDLTILMHVDQAGDAGSPAIERVSAEAGNLVTLALGITHELRLQGYASLAENPFTVLRYVVDRHLEGDHNTPTQQAQRNAAAEVRLCRERTRS